MKKYDRQIMEAIWSQGGTIKEIRHRKHMVVYTTLSQKPFVFGSTPCKSAKDKKRIVKYIQKHIKYNK